MQRYQKRNFVEQFSSRWTIHLTCNIYDYYGEREKSGMNYEETIQLTCNTYDYYRERKKTGMNYEGKNLLSFVMFVSPNLYPKCFVGA